MFGDKYAVSLYPFLRSYDRLVGGTGAIPATKPEAIAIFAPQDGRWKITVSFDGRRFCVPKFRH